MEIFIFIISPVFQWFFKFFSFISPKISDNIGLYTEINLQVSKITQFLI